jgi:hypothetical protein
MSEPEFADAKSTFLKKHLFKDIYGFVSFQLGTGQFTPSRKASSPARFRVDLWRNRGPLPHHGHGTGEGLYENWLYMPLGQLLWVVLDVKIYSWQYHEWEFSTSEELDTQLEDAIEKLVQYGIPWIEDPESRNPYSSWP